MLLSGMVIVSACHGMALEREGRAAIGHAEYLAIALRVDPALREELWEHARSGERTEGARLRTALLQSLPGHRGHEPEAAERALEALQANAEDPDVVVIAAIRLAAMREANASSAAFAALRREAAECRAEVDRLEERLSQVVNIEREMDGEEH